MVEVVDCAGDEEPGAPSKTERERRGKEVRTRRESEERKKERKRGSLLRAGVEGAVVGSAMTDCPGNQEAAFPESERKESEKRETRSNLSLSCSSPHSLKQRQL